MSEEQTTKKKTRTAAGIATDAYNRLLKVTAAENAELQRSPEEIRAKYLEKRREIVAKLDGEAFELTCRLLGEEEAAQLRELAVETTAPETAAAEQGEAE
jgi:hypothetical protein